MKLSDIEPVFKEIVKKPLERSLLLKAQEAKLVHFEGDSVKLVAYELGLFLKSQKCIKLLEERDQAELAIEDALRAAAITEDF